MKTKLVVLSLVATLASGCASIMGEPTQVMPIASTPSDAAISIIDEKGVEVFKGNTPTTVTLQKSDGSYWGGKTYNVTITKSGYKTQVIPVTANANGWYIGGNFLFGGLIGWFIVDPLTGSMYTLSPENIASTLGTEAAHNNTATDKSISIVLLADVPEALLSKMERVQ